MQQHNDEGRNPSEKNNRSRQPSILLMIRILCNCRNNLNFGDKYSIRPRKSFILSARLSQGSAHSSFFCSDSFVHRVFLGHALFQCPHAVQTARPRSKLMQAKSESALTHVDLDSTADASAAVSSLDSANIGTSQSESPALGTELNCSVQIQPDSPPSSCEQERTELPGFASHGPSASSPAVQGPQPSSVALYTGNTTEQEHPMRSGDDINSDTHLICSAKSSATHLLETLNSTTAPVAPSSVCCYNSETPASIANSASVVPLDSQVEMPPPNMPENHVQVRVEHTLNSSPHASTLHPPVTQCNNHPAPDMSTVSDGRVAGSQPSLHSSPSPPHVSLPTRASPVSHHSSIVRQIVEDPQLTPEERTRQRRMLRNRESAARSRDKRKFRNAQLETSIGSLSVHLELLQQLQGELSEMVSTMTAAGRSD